MFWFSNGPFDVQKFPPVKRQKFKPCICTWKLNDSAVASRFQEILCAIKVTSADNNIPADMVENLWSKLKGSLLEASSEVCGLSKNHQWRPKTWWWNDKVDDAVREKRARFRAYNALKEAGKEIEAKAAMMAYADAKRVAKHVVWLAKPEAENEVLANISPTGDGVFKIDKQMSHINQDVVGENCVRNDAGELPLSDDDKMKAWVEHYARLLNVEFEWPSDTLPEVAPVAGPPLCVTTKQDELW